MTQQTKPSLFTLEQLIQVERMDLNLSHRLHSHKHPMSVARREGVYRASA
eukprot:c46217_g1_i1 orf=94-243(-)